jgi:hypothetical protein
VAITRARTDGRRSLHSRPADTGGNRCGMVADGTAQEEILKAYPDLEHDDIREALRFVAEGVRERELPLVNGR